MRFLNVGVVDDNSFVEGAVIETTNNELALCSVNEYWVNEFNEKEKNEIGDLDIPEILRKKNKREMARELKQQIAGMGYKGKVYITEEMKNFLLDAMSI